MVDPLGQRIFGFLRARIRRLRSYITKRVVQQEKDKIDTELADEVEIKTNDPDDGLPQMGYFSIRLTNNSDIKFDIERIVVYLELDADEVPNRRGGTVYPIGAISAPAESITHNKMGPIDGHRAVIQQREAKGNIESYEIEFEIPSWMGDVEGIYWHGFLELQRGVIRDFSGSTNKGEIKTTDT